MSARKQKRHMGWIPDKPDDRDHLFRLPLAAATPRSLPTAVDLEPGFPTMPRSQGGLGGCTSFAAAAADEFLQARQPEVRGSWMPSPLFLYFVTRMEMGNTHQDTGASIRDTIKALAAWGVCPERMWPYDVRKFAVRPPQPCFDDAETHQAIEYQVVGQDPEWIRTVLAAGFPIVFGCWLYSSFYSRKVERTGEVPMPGRWERFMGKEGGHSMDVVGYDHPMRRFKVRNSYDTTWGQRGYCWMPYDYLSDRKLASDFWVIRSVEE